MAAVAPAAESKVTKRQAADEAKAQEQAAVVKRIVALRKKGKGYPAIAKLLNDEKVPTFGKGKLWYGPTVRAICIRELGGADASLKAAGTKRPTIGRTGVNEVAAVTVTERQTP